jgi:hypothetical protein
VAKFEAMIGGITVSQEGQFSGYLRGGDVKGVLDGCIPQAPNCVGAAVFEGRLIPVWLTGTVVDPSDGSVFVITLYKGIY